MLDPLSTLVEVAKIYGLPMAACTVVNVAIALVLRVLVRGWSMSRQVRLAALALAGPFGGLIAAAVAWGVVAGFGLQEEEAGMALVFLPEVLMPSVVGCLVWLVAEATQSHGVRPGLSLAGALAGSVVVAVVLLVCLEHPLADRLFDALPPTPALLSLWPLLGAFAAVGALAGQAWMRYLARTGWTRPTSSKREAS